MNRLRVAAIPVSFCTSFAEFDTLSSCIPLIYFKLAAIPATVWGGSGLVELLLASSSRSHKFSQALVWF